MPKRDLILLVEDDPDDEQLALEALSAHRHLARISVTRDGQEALDYLLAEGPWAGRNPERPRVVLMDLKLPKIDGLGVLSRIRGTPGIELLPVVIMTSSKQEEDLLRSYKSGANSYVQKPVDFDSFRAVVQETGLYWVGINEPVRDELGKRV